ncbi:hypothetical protein [Inconstantimicrobium mannanitabidum]|uniref:Uncharacterized protein n=1 Tax=Inconstantimicrobium mannanitabidum TaxID=1604901 RepID=A0ACB5R8C1_9CLOT|nr:hypothetical protein [Clostridium sp. TW13]GKX65286.1 hypothetical protein rsdtw13_05440 [Clostridium sp. TW13]
MRLIDFKLEKYNVNIHINIKNLLKTLAVLTFFIILTMYYVITMYKSLDLDKNGVVCKGTLTNYGIRFGRPSTRYVEYTFKVNNSIYSSNNNILTIFSQNFHVLKPANIEGWNKIINTNTIDILYLPKNPKINKPTINRDDLMQYVEFSFFCLLFMFFSGLKSIFNAETIYEEYILTKKKIRKTIRKKREVKHYFLWNIENL